jgi:uncharacterized protein YlxW (UPF0749 family)
LSKKSSRGCSVKSKAKPLEQLSQNIEEMNKNVQRISLEVTETKELIDTEHESGQKKIDTQPVVGEPTE